MTQMKRKNKLESISIMILVEIVVKLNFEIVPPQAKFYLHNILL